MREILFRGKRIDNGDWIKGYYVKTVDYRIDSAVHLIIELPSAFYPRGEIAGEYEINSSTVGQFTGLTDKNGRKIFEGDILSIAQKGNGIGDYFYPPLKYPSNAIVKWDKCSWMWEIIAEQRYYLTFPDAWCHFECKVIGNIHDNPELLGEVEE